MERLPFDSFIIAFVSKLLCLIESRIDTTLRRGGGGGAILFLVLLLHELGNGVQTCIQYIYTFIWAGLRESENVFSDVITVAGDNDC